jgi:hypothetical protein
MSDPRTLGHRPTLVMTLLVGVALWAGSGFLAFGCGAVQGGENADQTTALTSGPSQATSLPTTDREAPTTSTATPALTARTPSAAFLYLSERLTSFPVYSPAYLPAEAALAATWWPVTELHLPSDYQGPHVDNPRVDEAHGKAVAAQVILEVGQGWLAVLENYRGDLGDVAGDVVGEIQGNRATLYSVGGGTAVQWSDEGLWFVVFGRNLPASEVAKVALSMEKTISEPGRAQ